MTGPLEERFAQSLRDRTRGLSAERDLASEAVAQARRIRRRRRAGTAVAGVALVAIAIPIGWNATGGGGNDRTEIDPAQTPTQSEERTSPAPDDQPRGQDGGGNSEHVQRSLDFSELAQGDPPAIPYLADGAIHDGDARIPFDQPEVDSLRAVAGGYAVTAYGQAQRGLFLVRPDGSSQRLFEDAVRFAVSPDGGQRIAWAETSPDLDGGTLVVADGATGEQRYTLPFDEAVDVVGWVRGRVAFEYQDELRGLHLWNPETGSVTTVDGTIGGETTDGVELASVYTEFQQTEERLCGAVIDVGNGNQEVWGNCEQLVRDFSPDGRYAVTTDNRTDGLGAGQISVVEAATGRPVLTLDADVFFKTSWEPDGSLLVEVAEGGQHALVRCSLDGDCELATSPVAYDYQDQAGDPRPYVISQH